MNYIINFINFTKEFLWSFPMLVLLLGTHIYFTCKLNFIQKWIPKGIRLSFSKTELSHNGISPFAALATALASTIGTGNIIGIASAISIGGPGAVFWCWLTGVLGIATCYCECFLSVKYKTRQAGGPMYVLKNVLHMKKTAILFAVFSILASFGIGSSVQSNSIYTAIAHQAPVSPHIIGIITAVIAGFIMLGGVKQISKVCTFLVPFMTLFYLGGCTYLLFLNHDFLWEALCVIVKSAFSSSSFIGGMAGSAVMLGIRTGISKGLFTNEAGLGSIPMAAAASSSSSPITQGLISMTGPFWDTVVICAVTGIVIVSSMLKNPLLYIGSGDRSCFIAFTALPFHGSMILSISLVLFAFATIIGWCYYGECSIRFLAGEKALKAYQLIYILFIYLGAVMSLDFVWSLSDLLNSLMAIPNILSIWLLQKVIISETKKYF